MRRLFTRRSFGLGLPLVCLAFLATGCASSGTSAGGRSNPDVITREQIEARPELENAYDVVQQLHSSWLRARQSGLGGYVEVAVFLENTPYGGVESLRSIEATAVGEIHWIDARAATTRFGTGYGGGVIQVMGRQN